LQALDPTKKIWYWELQVMDYTVPGSPEPMTGKFRYYLDNRNDYNQLVLHYRNSIGGVDSVRLRGLVETTNDYAFSETENIGSTDLDQYYLPSRNKIQAAAVSKGWKADMGWLDKEEQDRLQDAFLNREVFWERFGRWWPVKLTSKNFRLRGSRDMQWSLPFEFVLADAGSEFYTPDINLGDGVYSTNVCPETVSIINHNITYDAGNATITFTYTYTGAPAKLQYKIPGFVDEWTDINPVFPGTLVYTVLEDFTITLYMRTVCTGEAYGSFSTRTVNTSVDPGEDNSTIYNDTPYGIGFNITRNAVEIESGYIDGSGAYEGFFCADGTGLDVVVNVTAGLPSHATLFSNGNTYVAIISGGTVTFANVDITGGCIIHLTDEN